MSNQHPFMHFDVIPDYRQKGNVEHKLTDIILLQLVLYFLVKMTGKRLASTAKLGWIS